MITSQEWKSRGSVFKVAGHDVFCITSVNSSKPALLLIHGFPTSSWDWQYIWEGLSKDFFVIAPDMLGFGFSDKPAKLYSIMEQADIMETVLAEFGVSRCHILAHDYGDTVAQELLARFNQGATSCELMSVCFLNGGLFPETHHARPIQKFLLSPLGFIATRLMGKKSFNKSFCAVFGKDTQPTDAELDEFWKIILYKDGQLNFHRLIRYMSERKQFRERWVSALQMTAIPLRVIDGADDPVSGVHMTERYRELVANPDVVLLEGIGHYPNTEAPKDVLAHYMTFINEKCLS
jgi:pimeloyl-ACP methyl ester carboxylesterase